MANMTVQGMNCELTSNPDWSGMGRTNVVTEQQTFKYLENSYFSRQHGFMNGSSRRFKLK